MAKTAGAGKAPKLSSAEKKQVAHRQAREAPRDLPQPAAGVHAHPAERPEVPALPHRCRRGRRGGRLRRRPAGSPARSTSRSRSRSSSPSSSACSSSPAARRRSMFTQAEGQAGAAGWMLQQQLRGDWRLTQAVAGTTQLDAVHRLVGRPGVVLVGEGAPHRLRGLLAQEKKRTARVVGDTPIYDITVGTGEGDIRLSKLNRYLLKLPRQPVQGPGRRAGEAAGRARRRPGAAAQGPDAAGREDAQRPALRPPPPEAERRDDRTAAVPRRAARPARRPGPARSPPAGRACGAFIVDAIAVRAGGRTVRAARGAAAPPTSCRSRGA